MNYPDGWMPDPHDPIGGPLVPVPSRTFDNEGRELPASSALDPAALAARLQAHALGKACMDSTQVTAAGKLLDHLTRRPETPAAPVAATLVTPSSVSDDEAMAEYLRMIE